MVDRLQQLLAPPIFPDATQTRLASWLNTLLLASLVVQAVYIPVSLIFNPDALGAIFIGLIMFVHAVLLGVLRRGQVRLASWLFCLTATGAMWLAILAFGGIRSSSYSSLILTVLITGLLLGGRAALSLAIIDIGLGWWLASAESSGLISVDLAYTSPANAWLGEALILVLCALLLGLANRSLRQALGEAQAGKHALQSRTAELEREHAALQQERDFVARLMETSPIGIMRLDRAGRVTFANPAAEQVWGAPRLELEQRTYAAVDWGLFGAEDPPLPAAILPFAQIQQTGQPVKNFRAASHRADGQQVSLSLNAAPLTNEQGHFDGVVATVEDITTQTQIEEQLRASEEQYRNFVEQSVEGIWRLVFDEPIPIDLPSDEQVRRMHMTAYVAECNDSLAKMYGLEKRQDLVGRRLTAFYGEQVNAENTLASRLLVESDYRGANRETREVNDRGEVVYFLNNAVGTVKDGCLVEVWGTQRDITDRKLAEQALAHRARQLQTVAELARDIASILDLNQLLPRVVDAIQSGFDLYYVGVFLIDEARQTVLLRAASGEAGQQLLAAGHQLNLDDQSMVGWCMLRRQARVVQNVAAEPNRFSNPYLPETRSEAALPLISRGQSIGALTIQSDQAHAFAAADIAVLQAMADQVAVAIDNARLFETEKRHAGVMSALRELGLDFGVQLDTLLKTIVTRAAQLLGAPMGDLLLLQPDGQSLREVANYNSPPEDQYTVVQLGEGVSGRVVLSGEPLIIHDYRTWSGHIPALAEINYQSVLGVPIMWQGKAIGVLNVLHSEPGQFTAEDAHTLQLFAAQVAVALENARLFDAIHQRLDELSVLHAVMLAATEAADVDQLLDRVMEVIGLTLFPDNVGVVLKEEALNLLRGRLYQAGAPVPLENDTVQIGQGVVGTVALTGQPWLIPDVRSEPAYSVLDPAILSELCVPMKIGERVIGVINVESKRLQAFDDADQQLLMTVAGQLATGIERLRAEVARRQKEDELAQERNLLRTLVDHLPDTHVFVKDTYGHFLTTNAAHLQTMGLTDLAQVVGKTDFDLFPPADAEQYFADEQAVLQSGEPLLNRIECVRDADGAERWYLTNKLPLHDTAGKLTGLVGMSLNITQRRLAEARQQAIAASLQAVVESADELLQIDDLDLLYRRAVELAREKLGLERCGIVILDDSGEFLLGTYGTDLQGRTTAEHHFRLLAREQPRFFTPGLRRWVLADTAHIYWDQGEMRTVGTGWVAITKIGPREDPIGWLSNDTASSGKPLDEVLQESLAVYCSLLGNIIIRKRTAQERETLINQLEAKNAELERFTYTVSHDLKSPLITIRGFLGFLQPDAETGNFDRLRSDVARITAATDKMQRLLNELLELSRIGRIVNAPQEISMTQLAQEALSLVEGRVTASKAQVEITPDLPTVQVDRVRLVEALQNLFDNAMKFMGDQPEPRLEIGLRADADPPVFFVKDNGIGIDPKYHDRVFGLFDKLDAKSEGTGVGLALVKRIIQVHGGRIWIESAGLGTGTTFCFTLPGVK